MVLRPLLAQHRRLSAVDGHNMAVGKVRPPRVLSDADIEEFVGALRSTIASAQKMPRALTKFALAAAGRR